MELLNDRQEMIRNGKEICLTALLKAIANNDTEAVNRCLARAEELRQLEEKYGY